MSAAPKLELFPRDITILRALDRVDTLNGPIPEHNPILGRCWLWTGHTVTGYGQIRDHYQRHKAHRFIYEATIGPIAQELELDHLCRNRRCVNPRHLEPVTHRENMLRSPISPSSENARKTHCKHGHEFTPENTLVSRRPGGRWRRSCRLCGRESGKRWKERQKAKLGGDREISGREFMEAMRG